MNNKMMNQIWNAKHVTVKSPEWYVVFSYEYVLRVVKTERQVHLLKLLLDQCGDFFEDDEAMEDLENLAYHTAYHGEEEDDETDLVANWEHYTSHIYAILNRAVTNRTPRPEDLEWMKISFIEQHPEHHFLNSCLKSDSPFSRHLQLIESIKMATFYYIYGNEER